MFAMSIKKNNIMQNKIKTIKAAVKIARNTVNPNVINVDDVIVASLFVSGGTLGNEDVEDIKQYINENLSSYELACGYVQTKETEIFKVSLYREYNVYHVIKYNKAEQKNIFWETFDTLAPAKKLFNKKLK